MNNERPDLSRPAAVHWRNPAPHQPELGNRERRFTTIANAIRFVIEDLTDFPQSTAWIATETRNLTLPEIREMYWKLPRVSE
jgi:hypothetical protein